MTTRHRVRPAADVQDDGIADANGHLGRPPAPRPHQVRTPVVLLQAGGAPDPTAGTTAGTTADQPGPTHRSGPTHQTGPTGPQDQTGLQGRDPEDRTQPNGPGVETEGVRTEEIRTEEIRTEETGQRLAPAAVDPDLVRLSAMAPDSPDRDRLRRKVIESHLALVHHLAKRFVGRGEPYDDLVQVGTIGLMHAVDRFDPTRGSFAGYAVPTIVGEIRRHFRDRGWAMRIPRRIQDLGRRVSEARETLTHKLDRSPTVAEMAAYLGVDDDLVLEALDTASAYVTVPLPASADETDRLSRGEVDGDLEQVEQRETLRPLLARLPDRERRIIQLRFVRGMSQSQIAGEVGVSQMHVSRLLAKSLATLRSGLQEDEAR